MVNRLDEWINFLCMRSPWTNVYGLARSLSALATFGTLAINPLDIIFKPIGVGPTGPLCSDFNEHLSLFCLLHDHLMLARLICLIILGLVIIGFLPRLTGVMHWWVNFSLVSSSTLIDGGDQVNMILSLLLIPITLTDPRHWHWENPPVQSTLRSQLGRLVANSTLWIIRLQIAIIYLHAGVAKCAVGEWQDGTAVYYWFTDPVFGLSKELMQVFYPLLANFFGVTVLTWSVILLEFFLFAGLIASSRWRRFLFIWGTLFHLGIILVHGLFSFGLIMISALILYLLEIDRPLGFLNPKSPKPSSLVKINGIPIHS